jgi:DNA-binding LacI/PurR family transcriptional regulator
MVVKLKHIAEEAGVTVSTVSRALSAGDRVSADLRQKIIRIAEARGYQRKKTTRVVSYVIDRRFFSLTSHFYNRIIEGISERLKEDSFTLQFDPVDTEKFSAESINLKNLAGMIVTSSFHSDFVIQARKLGLPVVLVDQFIPSAYIDSVLIDNYDGTMVGMQYLKSLGHSRIVYLAGELQPLQDSDRLSEIGYADRLSGYRRAVDQLGLDSDPDLIVPCGFSIRGGYEEMKKYLTAAKVPATAVMAVNDIVAIGAIEALKQRKIGVPAQVSVLGFDDIDLASDVIPKLSTMHVQTKTMGRIAADRLLQLVNGAEAGFTKTVIRTKLLVRESTGVRTH